MTIPDANYVTIPDANYVTIPDANFVNYLKTNFPTCINGNQLDTTCIAINDLQIITNTTVNPYVKQVSVDEKGFGNILLFPNPGKGLFHLKMDDKQPLNTLTISVYNLLGKIVWNAKSSSRDMLIDLNEQPNGVYFLRISAAEFSFTQRLIKQ